MLFIYYVIILHLFISQLGKGGGTPGTHNNTLKEDCKQDVTGTRRVFQYVYNDPNLQCYEQFFVNEEPPEGLRSHDDTDIRYICQPPTPDQQEEDTYYATMFDEGYGIAVFAAYKLTWANANFPGHQEHVHWCPTPGNVIGNSPSPFLFSYISGFFIPRCCDLKLSEIKTNLGYVYEVRRVVVHRS